VDFGEAQDIRDEIFEILTWIDSDLSKYTEYFNGINAKIDQVNSI